MSEQWKVAYKDFSDEGQATPNWNEEVPSEESLVAIGGEEACALLIPPSADDYCIFRRQEGGSWEAVVYTEGTPEELYALIFEDVVDVYED